MDFRFMRLQRGHSFSFTEESRTGGFLESSEDIFEMHLAQRERLPSFERLSL